MPLIETRARPAATFGSRRRWTARLSTAAGTLLALYVLLLSNAILFRHPVRFDLTEERIYSLSRATLDKLKIVGEPIQVVIPTLLRREIPEHVAYHEVLRTARLLLEEIMAAQPLIGIAAEVDVLVEPDRWQEVRARFDLDESQVNRLIFISERSKELRQSVTLSDLATFKEARDPALGAPQVKGFRGEKAITDAISRLISGKRQPVYFTAGRGEMQLRPAGAAPPGAAGLSAVAHELETEGMEVRELQLSAAKEIPADCALLVIAGPFQPFLPEELRAIEGYLERGGRLLVTLGPRRTGLEDTLKEWGVEVLEGKVQAQRQTTLVKSASALVTARVFDRQHPATSPFKDVPRFEVLLELPRPLSGTGKGKGLEATPLLKAESAEGDFFFRIPDRDSRELPKAEDFQLAVCVEQRVPPRPPPGFQRLETRILVVGSSSFLRDQYFLQASHRDFLMNSVAWLLGHEERATASGVEWADRVLRSDAAIAKFLFWVPIFLLPAVFLCAGAFMYYLRRA